MVKPRARSASRAASTAANTRCSGVSAGRRPPSGGAQLGTASGVDAVDRPQAASKTVGPAGVHSRVAIIGGSLSTRKAGQRGGRAPTTRQVARPCQRTVSTHRPALAPWYAASCFSARRRSGDASCPKTVHAGAGCNKGAGVSAAVRLSEAKDLAVLLRTSCETTAGDASSRSLAGTLAGRRRQLFSCSKARGQPEPACPKAAAPCYSQLLVGSASSLQ